MVFPFSFLLALFFHSFFRPLLIAIFFYFFILPFLSPLASLLPSSVTPLGPVEISSLSHFELFSSLSEDHIFCYFFFFSLIIFPELFLSHAHTILLLMLRINQIFLCLSHSLNLTFTPVICAIFSFFSPTLHPSSTFQHFPLSISLHHSVLSVSFFQLSFPPFLLLSVSVSVHSFFQSSSLSSLIPSFHPSIC